MSIKENAKLVRRWLKEHEFNFAEKTFDDGVITFKMSMASESGVCEGFDVTIVCRESEVQSLYHLPMRLVEKSKAQILELITRVNYRFRVGKFTVDMNDGEIRWEVVKGSAELKADANDAMDDLIGFPGFVLDRYISGLMAVVLGLKNAKQAFEDCEKDPPSEESGGPATEETVPPDSEMPPEEGGQKKSKRRGKKPAKKEPAPPPEEKSATPSDAPVKNYSLEGLNLTTPVPLKDIVAAVKKFRDGSGRPDVDAPRLNILLSGAPGSGKTAFVKFLAGEVGAPLRTLKASDLISRYSGETEKRIAEAFDEAKENGEILFLDEIDSFLQDRSRADKSWEVSQVNELLQQMEAFEGVMVGATNFADSLDRAVLRRFTYKLKLDYLTDEGKHIFFERYFKTPLTEEERRRLNGIANLTPGDFRTVRESLYYLSNRQTNAARLNALEAESKEKASPAARSVSEGLITPTLVVVTLYLLFVV